jgi:hypothetical protein
LAKAREIAAMPGDKLSGLSVDALARALFLLRQEAPAEVAAAQAKYTTRTALRDGIRIETGPCILSQAAVYEELYGVPCAGKLSRNGDTWPPVYQCSEAAVSSGGDPRVHVTLKAAPKRLEALPGDPESVEEPIQKSSELGEGRRANIQQRDAATLPGENLAKAPSQFCAASKCVGAYKDIVPLLYGARAKGAALPVFCAPRKNAGRWETERVACSRHWLDTLGGWQPWRLKEPEHLYVPNDLPKEGLPPFACLGSPHLLQAHMVLPKGGAAGSSGFHCRNRIFRVLAQRAEKRQADQDKNIALQCAQMRHDVWGEKYSGRAGAPGAPKSINELYRDWCLKEGPGKTDRSKCLSVKKAPPGAPGAPPLPYIGLSREELLFFFGHEELFCRGDRPGLTHFLFNKTWAKTFTCGVPRGLLESGPFEEGVQACAISPYVGTDRDRKNADLKARLHCWQFNRPTCEMLSNQAEAKKKDNIYQSNLFDAFDALREVRRTRNAEAWELYDLKDAEKMEGLEAKLAFNDTGADEGTFGVNRFCRFVDGFSRLDCSYDKNTIAQWYELRRDEKPQGCAQGVCARGAFARGYLCGLMSSPELFEGRPYWMCGIDVGPKGQEMVRGAKAVCVGGSRAATFQSAKGDRSSLHCYTRRFRWGESAESEEILRRLSWAKLVEEAGKQAKEVFPATEEWLAGGPEGYKRAERDFYAKAKEFEEQAKGAKAAYDELNKQKPNEDLGRIVGQVQKANADIANLDKEIAKAQQGVRISVGPFATQAYIWKKKLEELQKQRAQLVGARDAGNADRGRIEGERYKAFQQLITLNNQLAAFNNLYTRALQIVDEDRAAAAARFAQDRDKDLAELVQWAGQAGHTLGHSTAMRKLLMSSSLEVVKAFRALSLKETDSFEYMPLAGQCKDVDPQNRCWNKYALVKTEVSKALTAEKAKALSTLLDEARNGDRSASDKWYDDFRTEATDGDHLRISPEQLETVFRVHFLSFVLQIARDKLYRYARGYADVIFDKARTAPLLSRPELHEMAREAPIPYRFKGNVFCVADAAGRDRAGTEDYVCGSSPLLVPGAVERDVAERMKAAAGAEKLAGWERARAEAKFGWCYGATEGRPVFGVTPSFALSRKEWSSPYAMELPPKVVGIPSRFKLAARRRAKLKRPPAAGAKEEKPAEGKLATARDLGPLVGLQWPQLQSKRHWIRCAGFRFSDEPWEMVDPAVRQESLTRKELAQAQQAGPAGKVVGIVPAAGDDGRVGREMGSITSQIGGLLGSIVQMFVPNFDAISRIDDLAHAAGDFIDQWAEKLVDKARPRWDEAKAKLGEKETELDGLTKQAKEVVERVEAETEQARADVTAAQQEVDRATQTLHRADLKVAIAPAAGKEQAEAQKSAAKAKLKEAQDALAAKVKAVAEKVAEKTKAAQNAERVAAEEKKQREVYLKELRSGLKSAIDSGEVVAALMEDLVAMVNKRAMAIVEPMARNLLNRGVRYVRGVLDPVAKNVISALAGVPFVGAGLAALGQLAYSMALSTLEDAAFQALLGAVERLAAKAVRAVVGPIFKTVKTSVQKLAYRACASDETLRELCPEGGEVKFAALPPQHQWLERSFACRGGPIIDDAVRRDAVAAELRILRAGERMRKNAVALARGLADRLLARHGLSYDAMFAAATSAQPTLVARAQRVGGELADEARRMRARSEMLR